MTFNQPISRALLRLEQFKLIRRERNLYRSTRRWQGAMARASFRLLQQNEKREDLRLPITIALLELFGADIDEDELAELVIAMCWVESCELAEQRSSHDALRTIMTSSPLEHSRPPSSKVKR